MEYAKFALIIQRIRTEEMLVIFGFFFKFLGMNFSAVNFKAYRNFVLVIKNTYIVSFLLFSSVMHILSDG